MRVDVDGDDPAPILPWGLGVEVYDLSRATSGPTKGLVLFEAYGRGDPDATFVDLGTVPWLCNGVKQCRKKIDWLTDNKASGRRNANPHWSPDGRDYVFTDRENIDTEDVQIWTAEYGTDERREISTSQRFDYRPDWGRTSPGRAAQDLAFSSRRRILPLADFGTASMNSRCRTRL